MSAVILRNNYNEETGQHLNIVYAFTALCLQEKVEFLQLTSVFVFGGLALINDIIKHPKSEALNIHIAHSQIAIGLQVPGVVRHIALTPSILSPLSHAGARNLLIYALPHFLDFVSINQLSGSVPICEDEVELSALQSFHDLEPGTEKPNFVYEQGNASVRMVKPFEKKNFDESGRIDKTTLARRDSYG